MNQSTIYRILKRRGVRYTKTYKRWKADPKLYCLDAPGDELQLDASFPFGRYRKVVSIDAIDDCSRSVYAELYTGATIDNAIRRLEEDGVLGEIRKKWLE
jgi:hypothetical protein